MELELIIDAQIHLILVDDGSSTNPTNAYEAELKSQSDRLQIVRLEKNMGKGYALRAGLEKSKSDCILLTDVDFPFDNESMARVYQGLNSGLDIVFGKRINSYYQSLPFGRRVISRSFNLLSRLLLLRDVGDTQAGLKGLNQNGKSIYLETKTNGFISDFEFAYLAVKNKIKIAHVAIKLTNNISFKNFTTKTLGNEIRAFIRILRIKKD